MNGESYQIVKIRLMSHH